MVNLLNKNSSMTTRNFLENCFNGTQPIKRENPRAGESSYFYLVEDKNQLFPEPKPVDVPNGVDPYAFRDAGYKIPSMQSTQDTGSFTNNTSPFSLSASPGSTLSSSTPSLSASSSLTSPLQDTTASRSSFSTPTLSSSSASNGLTSSMTPSSNPLSTPGANRTSTDTIFSNSSTSTAHPWEKSNFSLNQSAPSNNGFSSLSGTSSTLDNNPYSLYKNPRDFGMQNNASTNPYDSYSQTTNPWSGLNAFSGAPQSVNGGFTSSGETGSALDNNPYSLYKNPLDSGMQNNASANPYDLNQLTNPWASLNAFSGDSQSVNDGLNTTTAPSPTDSQNQGKTYILQAHSRKLNHPLDKGIELPNFTTKMGKHFIKQIISDNKPRNTLNWASPYHSGFDLIETDKNGNQKMQSVDLTTVGNFFPTGGTSKVLFTEGPAQTYTLPDGRQVTWYNQLEDSQKSYENVPNYLIEKKLETRPLLKGKEARDAFYRMQVESDFTNAFNLNYNLVNNNCNTHSTMLLNNNVSCDHPKTMSGLFGRNHYGDTGSYTTSHTDNENRKGHLRELSVKTYLNNTPQENYQRAMNIRYVPGTFTTGPMATFSNGKNQFVINSHDRNQPLVLEETLAVLKYAPFLRHFAMQGIKDGANKIWPNQFDIYMDNKFIKRTQ